MDHGKLNQATRKNFVVPVPTVATSTVPIDQLGVGQIGILDIDKTGLYDKHTFTSTPVDKKGHQFEIHQGIFSNDTIDLLHSTTTNYDKKTTTFKAKDIVRWSGKKARKVASTQQVAIGWDGVNAGKNFNVDKFNDTHINLRLTGGPINKIMGHNKGYRTSFVIPHECYNICDPDLPEGNPMCAKGLKEVAADWLLHEFNQRMIGLQGTRPLNKIIRMTKITTATISGLTTFDTYEVLVPDNGDNASFGLVQAQYPGLTIERTSFVDGISTYRVVVADGAAAPAAVSNAGITTLAYCSVCPTGYTASTAVKKYVVTLNHGAATTQFTGVTGYTANTPVSKSVENGDVYIVYSSNATNQTTFANAVNTNGGSATYIGQDSSICVLSNPSTYSWSATESLTRASKNYMITLKDDECGQSRLAELQAYYPQLTITGDASATNCSRNYSTTVYSDPVEDGCFPDTYKFSEAPAPFFSIAWNEIVSASTDPDNVGIIIEGGVFKKDVPEHLYDYWAFDQDDVDGVHIEVSTHSNNYMQQPCRTDIPVTTLSYFEYPSGEGWFVRKMEEESNGYEMNHYRSNPALRAVYGQEYFSKLDKYYDSYSLEVVGSGPKNGAFDRTADHRYLYTFYFEVGRGKAFENAINGLIASSGADVLPVSL